jgi:ATP-dependent Clp protease adaptor protein ClpS
MGRHAPCPRRQCRRLRRVSGLDRRRGQRPWRRAEETISVSRAIRPRDRALQERSAPANRLETGEIGVQNIGGFQDNRRRESTMSKIATKIAPKTETRVQRPRLHKVILFNDDYTPRDFVVEVLKAVFRLNETQALNVMTTAHRKGVCVVAVFVQDVAETKAARGTEAGAAKGYPLRFGTEPEE